MRCDVLNMLRIAARALDDDGSYSPNGYGFLLRELAKNLRILAEDPGKHWEEFADIYCLSSKDKKE